MQANEQATPPPPHTHTHTNPTHTHIHPKIHCRSHCTGAHKPRNQAPARSSKAKKCAKPQSRRGQTPTHQTILTSCSNHSAANWDPGPLPPPPVVTNRRAAGAIDGVLKGYTSTSRALENPCTTTTSAAEIPAPTTASNRVMETPGESTAYTRADDSIPPMKPLHGGAADADPDMEPEFDPDWVLVLVLVRLCDRVPELGIDAVTLTDGVSDADPLRVTLAA